MSTAPSIRTTPHLINIKVTSGPHLKEEFSFRTSTCSIGRGAENDIVLPNDPKMSRAHVKISNQNGMVFIENLSLRNPMIYRDNTEQKISIKPGDRFRIGESELEVHWQVDDLEKTVKASDLSFQQNLTENTAIFSKVPEVKDGTQDNLEETLMPLIPNKILQVDFKDLHFSSKGVTPDVKYNHHKIPIYNGSSSVRGGGVTNTKIHHAPQTKARSQSNVQKNNSSPASPALLITVALVIIGVLLILPIEEKKGRKIRPLKDTDQIKTILEQSNQIVDQHIKEKHLTEDGKMDRQFESSQSYYIKGFRDYRQGQYTRAIMSFQAALSFDPNHMLARRYLNQSIKKLSEIVQFNVDQARRYRLKNNYRLCRSAAQQVMTLRRDQSDSQYKEAKLLFDECNTLSKGRF